ncbi:MAG: cysteine synthase family protein [Oscillospiraceae bacterium]|nr:cysteine synthase family protein [Oscillospiraceae bacterium]
MPEKANICNSILEAVGNTPLIRLNKMTEGLDRNIFVKFEGLNPGGSIKTRTALNMIKDAEAKRLISPGKNTIVEYTSGNQGIGLALVSAVLGYDCVIVMPECMSEERKKIIRAYGAEIICTPVPDGGTINEAFDLAKNTALELAASDTKYFLAAQFENQANCNAHTENTAREIIEQMNGAGLELHAFVASAGTGGTITGCSRAFKKAFPKAKMITVEPENSAIITGGKIGIHGQQGIGDGFIPEILDMKSFDYCVVVGDEDAFATAKKLALQEGIFCGISSGTNVFAAIEYAKNLPEGSNIVTICADLGDRYLSVEGFI